MADGTVAEIIEHPSFPDQTWFLITRGGQFGVTNGVVTPGGILLPFPRLHKLFREVALGNRLIIEAESGTANGGPIQCRQRLGGMLNYYYRQAA